MPPRKDKENKEDVDSKFNAILEKLEEFKAENDTKLGQKQKSVHLEMK